MMERSMQILVIDNLAVESVRREVYRCLGRSFGCDVHVLVPTSWKETRGRVACEPEEGNAVKLHRSRIAFGYRHQRVVYLDLPTVIRNVKPDFILAVAQPESYAAAQICIDRWLYAPEARLGFYSSRNIDFAREGFPYRLKSTHRMCDAITRRSRPDICFYRPEAAGRLLAPYAKRLVYAPHVVDCTLFRKDSIHSAADADRPFTVGYVGRLVKEKGVHVLIEALRRLPDQVRLVTIGEGPEEDSLRRLADECGLAGRADFRPPIPYAKIPGALGNMDVLVLPSLETPTWTELFGRVLIEAMACEVPIVASRSGGIPEVVGNAAMLVKPGDSHALATALEHLLNDTPARREIGREGRERALCRFDVPVVATLLGSEIMDVVASAGEEVERG